MRVERTAGAVAVRTLLRDRVLEVNKLCNERYRKL